MKRERAFKRDAFLGLRMPSEDKARLKELARKRRRDVSNVALEAITNWIQKEERREPSMEAR